MPLTNPGIRALSGGTASLTGGTVVFSNANNVSFGIDGQTITASIVPGGGAGDGFNIIAAGTQTANTTGTVVFSNSNGITFGMSGSSQITASYTQSTAPAAISAGTTQATNGTVVFSNANNVSFGMNAGTVTATVTVAATPETPFGVSAGTQSVSTGTLVFSNSNGVSFGMSGSSRITASVDGIKTVTGPSGGVTNGQVSFANANGVSFGFNGSTITASVATQTNQTLGMYALGNTTGQSSSSTFDARTVSVEGAGLVSVGYSAGSLRISATAPAQTNQSLGMYALGNTTGQSSSTTFDARSVSVEGAGIVSVGYSAGSLRVSATAPAQTNQTLGMYALGNTTGQSSSSTFDARSVSVEGAGIVSVGYSAGSLRVSATQSNQTLGAYAVSNTTQSSSGTIDARSLSFQGRGGVSVGVSNGSVVISSPTGGAGDGYNIIAAGTQTANTTGTIVFSNSNNVSFGMTNSSIVTASFERSEITAGANITLSSAGSTISVIGNNPLAISAGTNSSSSGTVVLSNSNGITFGMSNNGVVTASHNALTSQSNQAVSGTNGSFTFQTVTFGNINGISFYTSNNSMVASYTVPTQTNQTLGLYGVGNTTGQSSSSTYDARSVTFSGAGMVSVGNSGGSYILSATQSNQVMSVYAVSNSTQSSSGTVDARSHSFAGAGIASVGVSNGSVIISVPSGGGAGDGVNIIAAGTQTANTTGTVVFSNSNGVSFGMSNSSVITASVGSATISTFQNRQFGASTTIAPGQNSLWLVPFRVADYLSASSIIFIQSYSGTITSAASARYGGTIDIAIFSQSVGNSTKFDTMWSAARNMTFWNSGTSSYSYDYGGTTSSSAGSNLGTASVMGVRIHSFTIGSTITPGLYIFGLRLSSSTAGYSAAMSRSHVYMDNPASVGMGTIGQATNNSLGYANAGTWSVTTGAMPASIALTDIRPVANVVPWFKIGAY